MRLIATLAACAVLMVAASAQAGEPMNLSKMGLKGLKPMTNAEGMNVRGRGLVLTGGFSRVNIGGISTATQFNFAGSLQNNALAVSGSSVNGSVVNQQTATTTVPVFFQGIPIGTATTTQQVTNVTTASASGISFGFAR